MEVVKGWAVCRLGKPIINTVHETRRGAIVNWLIVEAQVRVLASWHDQAIERAWEVHSGPFEATVHEVAINVLVNVGES